MKTWKNQINQSINSPNQRPTVDASEFIPGCGVVGSYKRM